MSWILEYFVLYLLRVYIYMFGWLCRATYYSVVSTSMLGVSHAIQNEKNSRSLQRVIAYICYTLMLGVSHVVEVLVLGLLVM